MTKITHEEGAPLWYKDAIIYEVRVRSFADSNGDGIGDFPGLTGKLDYIQELGVTALWLLPFYPSPLRDDGYDISSYTEVHPECGTLVDFRRFVREAHARGIRVITELVLNHTSDQHLWFQRARRAKPGSRYRDFYVWSDTPERYKDVRIIFKDYESSNWTWDPVAKAYYWHRFFSHQPDLNFENPQVRRAMIQVLEFWLGMGVDGLRLDAVPYLFVREGTNGENLPETHEYLKTVRAHVDERFQDRMLLAEANQWPEDAVAYFGEGDECHMAFHFPVMPRMFMAIQMEDRYPITDIIQETPAIPDNCQWALFLRNHDELTLEMVTDEERDYMYRMYAYDTQARINLGIRRRLAPLLQNNRRKIELMNGLLFSLPGTPVLYYGDEIGMGDNIYLGDRNGVRTPMQWSADRNAGFSRANPQLLYLPIVIDPEFHYETINVETQHGNATSLWWWMRRLIALRKNHPALGQGSIEFLHPANSKVLAFLRRHEGETLLVVANLSRFPQYIELDLATHQGQVPVELFGMTPFPAIEDKPYLLTLGPHSFDWFQIETPHELPGALAAGEELPALSLAGRWPGVLQSRTRHGLEGLIPAFLQRQRWFGGKERRIRTVTLQDAVSVPMSGAKAAIILVRVQFTEGSEDIYQLPLVFAPEEHAQAVLQSSPQAGLARLTLTGSNAPESGVLYDAMADMDFCRALLKLVTGRRRLRGQRGTVIGLPARGLRGAEPDGGSLEPHPLGGEQSNNSVVYGEQVLLKLFRRLDEGDNPELEIGRHLTEVCRFSHTPDVLGHMALRQERRPDSTLGVLTRFIPNQGDAWHMTQHELSLFFDRMETLGPRLLEPPHYPDSIWLEPGAEPEEPALIGPYLELVRLLGQRTAEMHLALATPTDNPMFSPEPFSTLYQRSLSQAFRAEAKQTLALLQKNLKRLDEPTAALAQRVLAQEGVLHTRLRGIAGAKLDIDRIRIHGDYHLGQVMYTGRDFIIIDFEGEPLRSIGERRIKRASMRDVAGMIRSFDYAVHTALQTAIESHSPLEEHQRALEAWGTYWLRWTSGLYLQAYMQAVKDSELLPSQPERMATLLDVFLLQKALYEVNYEVRHRPAWLSIPLRGLAALLESEV